MKVRHFVVQLLVTIVVLGEHTTNGFDPVSVSLTAISAISTVAKISQNVLRISQGVKGILSRGKLRDEYDDPEDALDSFRQIRSQIYRAEMQYSQSIAMATESVNGLISQNIPLILIVNEIKDTMNRISTRYQQMLQYEVYKDKLEPKTLIAFAEWSISPNAYSVSHLMERLHLSLFKNGKTTFNSTSTENILSLLTHNYEVSNEMCRTQQAAQQFVYSLYSDIALTELKGYTMMEFSLMALRMYGQGNYTQEEQIMRAEYARRTQEAIHLLRKVMQVANRTVYRCDPESHIPRVTYDEVTRLLQGYVENEVDMHQSGSCWSSCAQFDHAHNRGCYHGLCTQQSRCSGEVRNCRFIRSDMWLCPSARSSYRRYEFIDYVDGPLLGPRQNCERESLKAESWTRWFFWHCSYCFCLCDEQSLKSDRYFNLRETLADFKQNKVVTGLRFIKQNRVFHLQIQQGKMLPLGIVDETTIEWKPVDSYGVYDANVTKGVDFHTLSYWSRSLDLDTLLKTNGNNNVLTGVRFRVLNSHLNLMARFSEFDFKSGRLLDSEWHSNEGQNRQDLNLENLDLPNHLTAKSMPLSHHNQYLQFVNSGLYQDAAQTTVPFLDIQDVVSIPPVPLAGIGLHYKSRPGFAGFVAPKIITYDYTSHVQMPKTASYL